jgi:ectoine hydroxylase-related dioxygenase (phytanoyl-CoA dioxygenase family)
MTVSSGLTPVQREKLSKDGYFVVKHALSSTEVERLTAAVDGLFQGYFESEAHEVLGRQDLASIISNVLEGSDELIPLIDHPVTFPLVLDLLGPYITLGLAESTVKRPCDETGDRTGFIHSDGGHSLSRIWVAEQSRPLQVKTHYFLTDCRDPDRGNFAVVPGSQRRVPHWAPGADTTPDEVGAVPLLVGAGDCVMWTHSLWHGALPNRSSVTRKTITFAYNQMFMRPLMEPPSERLLAKCSLRQRRLLGDLGADAIDPIYGRQFGFLYAPSDYADIMLSGASPKRIPA